MKRINSQNETFNRLSNNKFKVGRLLFLLTHLNKSSLILTLILLPIINSSYAQKLISFCDACVDVNEKNLFHALWLSFGQDSACLILNSDKTTLIKVYVDSLSVVNDVVIVNSVRARYSLEVRNKLLDVIKRNNITFQKCYELPQFEAPDHVTLSEIKKDYCSYLISYYHNRIPISIFVLKSDFLKWVDDNIYSECTPSL